MSGLDDSRRLGTRKEVGKMAQIGMEHTGEAGYPTRAEDQKTVEMVSGGSIAEGVGGIAAVVLAILGLAGMIPMTIAAIATIVVGVALLAEGGAIASRYAEILSETSGGKVTNSEFGGGMTAELLGGVAGVALGVLALVGIAPMTLIAVGAIVFGACLVMGSGTVARMNNVISGMSATTSHHQAIQRESMMAATGAQSLVGIGVVVLGILAIIGISPLVLVLVALLAAGGSLLLTGGAVTSRVLGALHH